MMEGQVSVVGGLVGVRVGVESEFGEWLTEPK
jgi:hypothetical protein